MRAWLRWTLLIVAAALFAPMSPAQAAFGECSSAAYRGLFDERYAEPRFLDFDCVERMRVPVATSGGTRHIRIIHDRNADWIADDSTMAAFERGVRAAAETIGRLGGVELEDVTILLADDLPPGSTAEAFSNIAGQTEFTRDDECHVVLYLIGPASDPELAASIAAHEIFHCVQVANLSAAQMASGASGTGAGGDWWLEGSAEWFSALALPDRGLMPANADAFDELSPTTPLNELAYSAGIFFLWLGAEVEPAGVMGFLDGMADSNAPAAQHAAMSAALPPERWLDFAQAYLDRAIRHPHGVDIGLDPRDGDTWDWSATRTQTLPLAPFVLTRGVATFQCGRWRTSVRPASAHGARDEAGGSWATLPEEIDASSGGGRYRVAAINATASRITLSIEGVMESGCGDCAGVRTLDACVVGHWQLTGGGPIEWMRANGVPITNASTANTTVTFRADGTFVTGAVQAQLEMEYDSARGEGEVRAQASGRWSTDGGRLNYCTDAQSFGGQATMTTRDGDRRTMTLPSMPPESVTDTYTCSATALDAVRTVPRASPMPFHYTRAGGG